jgi:hypothetical protein
MRPVRGAMTRRRRRSPEGCTIRGALNLFQAQMLRWRELHPYNAVHVAAIDPKLAMDAVTRAIARVLEHWGLTGLVLDAPRRGYEWRGGPAQVALRHAAHASLLEGIEREIEHDLNAPFADANPRNPFRFFVVSAPDGAALGLAYDHFIAGGDCILALLHAIVAVARGGDLAATQRPDLYPPTQARLFLRNLPRLLRGAARLPAQVASTRAIARPRYRDVTDGYDAYALFTLPAAHTRRLLDSAKAWSVTVNDMLLALLLVALDPLAPWRRTSARRRSLAVASIMNLRGEYGEAGQAAFGQFLGSLRVTHPVPPGATLESIAHAVHAETAQVKERKLYLQTLLAMRYVAAVWRVLEPAQRAGFYAKSYPIWAGVSALNVNALWARPAGEPTPLYVRGVPTGPLAPVVLAVTTVGDTLYAGFSFRTAAFSRDDIQQLWAGMVRRLDPT